MSLEITRVLCGMIRENAYVVSVAGRRDCAVIDPGDDFPALKRAVGERQLGAILLTHGHFDHILGAGPLARETGAPVYVAAEDAEMLGDARLNGYAHLMGVHEMPGPALQPRAYGERLSVCGMTFDILRTPGHSKGSVCLYLAGEGVLFSGDTLFCAGYGRLDLHGGDAGAMLQSLKALFELPGGVKVLSGHGEATTIGEERARYRL
ncbi:MAG: MBL fold metallo-hydrolase [Clostridia bacterium]|nr:MBL fold metallo-hydrolase [Clostridia bacterium]